MLNYCCAVPLVTYYDYKVLPQFNAPADLAVVGITKALRSKIKQQDGDD
jgi:hypothetical protein